MKDSDLKKLQEVELTILKDVDEYCTEHGINYSLSGGTLLGAVRHKEFIPWDDDTDTIMTRENYEKFLKTWEKEPMEGYVLQYPISDYACGNNHTKLRKKGTKYLTGSEQDRGDLSGIWIDIFVIDKVDNNQKAIDYMRKVGRKRFAITRGYSPSSHDGLKLKLMRLVLRMMYSEKNIPEKFRETELELQKYRNTENDHLWIDVQCEAEMYRLLPENVADSYVRIPFCDGEFMVFGEYEKVLEAKYGDYMQLPPEEDRVCKHNPTKLIFG